MAEEPLIITNETRWSPPQNGVIPNGICAGQVIPSLVIQTGIATQSVGQELGSHHIQTQKYSQVLKIFLKAETKTLGVIQIMIGLIQIGFGGVLAVLFHPQYVSLATITGCPFWSGLFFIGSGSLSVSAEKYLSRCWVKYTVGMNITSAVMAAIGMLFYLTEMTANPEYDFTKLHRTIGLALGTVLLLFSLLEFCIATSTAHLGCKAVKDTNDQVTVFVPCADSGHDVAPAEKTPVPPAHNNEIPSC